ncbi:MAG: carbohydrate ABC transporter permease [Bacillota bacterium]
MNFLKKYKKKAKILLLGGAKPGEGLIVKFIFYALLIAIGFVYLYPLLYMLANSFMNMSDLISSSIRWLPSGLYLENYRRALQIMDVGNTFWQTILVAGLPSILQTISTAVVGYGFARFEFPGRRIFFVLMLATFIIPPQITMIPRYLLFSRLEMLGTFYTFVIPAALAQGLRNAIFILIFYQMFKQIPGALIEAGKIDGAGTFKIFYKIAVPLSIPAIVIVFLFSFVWYWNETYLASVYFGNVLKTLPLALQNFADSFSQMQSGGDTPLNQLNEAITMAGTLLTISPLLVLYFVLQRWFVESVDRTGITGE